MYLFLKNFDAAKKLTRVDGMNIKLDNVTLSLIFCLPEGSIRWIEQRLNDVNGAPCKLIGLGLDAACSNGYKMKKCTNNRIMERPLI